MLTDRAQLAHCFLSLRDVRSSEVGAGLRFEFSHEQVEHVQAAGALDEVPGANLKGVPPLEERCRALFEESPTVGPGRNPQPGEAPAKISRGVTRERLRSSVYGAGCALRLCC